MITASSNDTIIRDILEKDIVELLGLESLPKEKQEEYRKKASETIYNRAFTRIVDLLEEKGLLSEFEAITDNDSATEEFLKQNGIDLKGLIIDESLAYKTQMKIAADLLDFGIDVTPKSK